MPPAGRRASYDVLLDPFFDVEVPVPLAVPVVLPVSLAVLVPLSLSLVSAALPVFEAVSAAVVFSLPDADAVLEAELLLSVALAVFAAAVS